MTVNDFERSQVAPHPHAPREREVQVGPRFIQRVCCREHATIEAHCVLPVGREDGEHICLVAGCEKASTGRTPAYSDSNSRLHSPSSSKPE